MLWFANRYDNPARRRILCILNNGVGISFFLFRAIFLEATAMLCLG